MRARSAGAVMVCFPETADLGWEQKVRFFEFPVASGLVGTFRPASAAIRAPGPKIYQVRWEIIDAHGWPHPRLVSID